MSARKRSLPVQAGPAAKRLKTQDSSEDRVAVLEAQVTAALDSSSSLNPLVDLICLASDSDAALVHTAIYALYRLFTRIHSSGLLLAAASDGSDAALVKSWTIDRQNEFVDVLCMLLRHREPALRTASLDILMSLLKSSSSALSVHHGQPRFDAAHFRKIVTSLLTGRSEMLNGPQDISLPDGVLESGVRDLFLDKWLSVNDDVRWFFLREATHLIQQLEPSCAGCVTENLLSLLERLTTMPTTKAELNSFWIPELSKRPNSTPASSTNVEDDEDPNDWLAFFEEPDNTPVKERVGRTSKLSVLQSLHHLPSHRAEFSFAWLALLSHITTPAHVGRALSVLHKLVLPHFTRPLRLMDWISGCVDHGGVIGLLSLNALFTLMKDHNLDYPNFYARLYGFVNRDVLHLKYRARFFRLLELFLSSTHLPTTLLASFLKRLSRLSIAAPPSAIVMIIPFTYNILKEHPSLMVLIHRDRDSSGTVTTDPFNAEDPNPLTTNAMGSSLWELNTHREHYFSSVSTMTRVLSEPFTKPAYTLEDFLDHTYGTIFEAEAKRRIKKEPALAVEYAGPIFPGEGGGAAPEEVRDVVAELWSF